MIIKENWRNFVKENLKGNGLEIGAFFQPFPINEETKITYQDILTTQQLIVLGQNDKNVVLNQIVNVDIVRNAHDEIKEKYDFICNSHVVEHLYNPLLAIKNWSNALNSNGYLFMVIPDRNYTFDQPRGTTTWHHLEEDYYNDTYFIEAEHYLDFYGKVHPTTSVNSVLALYEQQFNIHVHTFDEYSVEFMSEFLEDNTDLKRIDIKRYGMNISMLMQKE